MKRPKGVTIIALWDFAGSALALILSVFFFFFDKPLFDPIVLLAGVALLPLGIGLWKMRSWARAITIIGTLVGLLIHFAWMILFPFPEEFSRWNIALIAVTDVLNLTVAVYLMTPTVRGAFVSSRQVPTPEGSKPRF